MASAMTPWASGSSAAPRLASTPSRTRAWTKREPPGRPGAPTRTPYEGMDEADPTGPPGGLPQPGGHGLAHRLQADDGGATGRGGDQAGREGPPDDGRRLHHLGAPGRQPAEPGRHAVPNGA